MLFVVPYLGCRIWDLGFSQSKNKKILLNLRLSVSDYGVWLGFVSLCLRVIINFFGVVGWVLSSTIKISCLSFVS